MASYNYNDDVRAELGPLTRAAANMHPIPDDIPLESVHTLTDMKYPMQHPPIIQRPYTPTIQRAIAKKSPAMSASTMPSSAAAAMHASAMQRPLIQLHQPAFGKIENRRPVQRALNGIPIKKLRELCIKYGLDTYGNKEALSNKICDLLPHGHQLIREEAHAHKTNKHKGGRSRKHKVKSHRRNSSMRAY
jgi:hypothetical protein